MNPDVTTDSLGDPTIEMTMDVNVELLWTRTVPRMPNMRPAIGLEMKESEPNRSAGKRDLVLYH